MAADTDAGATEPPPLLARGRVDRIRVQVGHRVLPDGPAHEHFLLDLAVDEEEQLTERAVLGALEPLLYAGTKTRRHHSVHRHQWHTSWGAAPGALEIGLLVTTGSVTPEDAEASLRTVADVFAGLVHRSASSGGPVSRDGALIRARRAVASTYDLDPDRLAISAEEHHPAHGSWTVGIRGAAGDWYHAQIGFVDGYAGAVHVRHTPVIEVSDSVGEQ